MSAVRALLIALVALAVIAPTVPAAADRLLTDTKVARKTRAQKQQNSSTTHRQKPDTQKKQDTEITVGRGTIDPIGTLTRGQTYVIKATALRNGELCSLQIFYADKPATTIRDVVPDQKKRCAFTIPVPDRPGAVGEGKAKLILTKATSGKKSGEANQVFSVT